jgi:phosphoribosylformylglycinamidine synthase PurS subunit
MLKARVIVTLKNEVSDPAGHAVRDSLNNLHPDFTSRVRVGKILDIDLKATDRAEAEKELHAVCRELLSNPVIEEYSFEIREVAQ